MAIACLRLLTFLPPRPLLSVPFLRFFIARSTYREAPREYLRAVGGVLLRKNHGARCNVVGATILTAGYGTLFLTQRVNQ